MKILCPLAVLLLLFTFESQAQTTPTFFRSVPFISGQGGYNTYRIPAIVRSTNGTLLAFCEGRVYSSADDGDINIVLRRSTNNGVSWLPLIVIQSDGGTNTIGNPSPVVDETTGYIHLLFCLNNDQVFHSVSTNDGITWSTRNEITSDVKLSSWGWYATGPGHGIQLKCGQQAGRLVVACDHITTDNVDGSHVIYSDDHGVTWQLGGINDAVADVDPNETTCVEVNSNSSGGSGIYFNSRATGPDGNRGQAWSINGGSSYTGPFTNQSSFVCPVVEGNLLRLEATEQGSVSNRILFSCPNNASDREMISVWSSTNEAVSWSAPRLVDDGPSGYSDMACTSSGQVAMLYEEGDSYENITFACFNQAWLDSGGPIVNSLLPENGANSTLPTPLIQAVFLNQNTSVVLSSMTLFVDGTNVTAGAVTSSTATTATIDYTPAAALAGGSHTATVIFNDNAAPANTYTNTWNFSVLPTLPLVSYWQFNEQAPGGISSTSPSAILDSSGNDYNGTTPNPVNYVAGDPAYDNGSALDFAMSDEDYVDVPDPTGVFTFGVSQSFTLEALINTTDGGESGIGCIVGKVPSSSTAPQWWFRIDSGKLEFLVNNGTQQFTVTGLTTVTNGDWHHVAAVYNASASSLSLYVDYSLDSTASAVFTNGGVIGTDQDVAIGAFSADGDRYFDGDMDFVRISTGALSPSQFVQASPTLQSELPASGANNVSPMPLIQAVFLDQNTSVALNSMELFVDGANVTAGAVTSSNATTATIAYNPAIALAGGAHTATVTFNDNAVPPNFYTNTWSFNVLTNVPILALWQFNEQPAGSTVSTSAGAILDATGNGYNGTTANRSQVPMIYVAGDSAYGGTPALNFVSADSNSVVVPDPTGAFNFPPSQSMTFEALIQTTNGGQANVGAIVGKVPSSSSASQWWWRVDAGKQQFLVNNGTTQISITGGTIITNGAWHDVAAIYDSSLQQLRLYIDGASDATPVSAVYSTGTFGNYTNLCIGEFIGTVNRFFNGNIDFVRISSAALDPSWFMQAGPAASQGPLQLNNIAWSGGTGSFKFATGTGHSYIVQAATSLTGSWTNLEVVTGNGSITTVNLPVSGPQKFFRVVEY